jgi:hypothetical protein
VAGTVDDGHLAAVPMGISAAAGGDTRARSSRESMVRPRTTFGSSAVPIAVVGRALEGEPLTGYCGDEISGSANVSRSLALRKAASACAMDPSPNGRLIRRSRSSEDEREVRHHRVTTLTACRRVP